MEFYSEERFKNWINKIKECEVNLEDVGSLNVFDQMVEDFTIACFNILKALKSKEISKKEAIEELEMMNRLILTSIDFGDDMKNEFFEFIRESIRVVIHSAKLVIEGKISRKSFEQLLNEAIKKEKQGDLVGAFETIAKMGAKVFKGEKLPELDVREDGFVVNWLDGVEVIDMVIKLNELDVGN